MNYCLEPPFRHRPGTPSRTGTPCVVARVRSDQKTGEPEKNGSTFGRKRLETGTFTEYFRKKSMYYVKYLYIYIYISFKGSSWEFNQFLNFYIGAICMDTSSLCEAFV